MVSLLLACADPVNVSGSPASLDYGEVDFTAEVPDGGFASLDWTVTNVGDADVTLTLPAYDDERLCVDGFDVDTLPQALPAMSAGGAYVFHVGICGYVAGEEGGDVQTELTVQTDTTPASLTVPITYTAIRVTE